MGLQTTHFKGNLDIGGTITAGGVMATTEGTLRAPTATAAPSSPTVGDMYYNSTTKKFLVYQDSGWASVDGTSAGSLDGSYNGGGTVTVDAADVIWDLTDASNDYKVLIRNSSTGTIDVGLTIDTSAASAGCILTDAVAITTSGAGSTITDALDVSDAGITNAINVGANNIVGTTAVINFDNFDVDASGNTTVAGTLGVTGASTLGGALAVTGAITNSSSITSQGQIIVDVDNAEALLIRSNGDGGDVLAVDTTSDAGDTNVLVTTAVTTGTGMHINGATITTGDVLKITVAAATMTAAGAAISVVADGTEVFAVRDDGSIYSKATAEGTTAWQVATGDVVISDGDFTVSGGEVSITDGVTTTGAGVTITSSMTTAGAGAGAAGALVITAASATTGTVLAITADALTSGDMLFLDNGGATLNGGFYINCNDDNVSDFTVGADGATTITTAVATTAALTVTGVQTSQSMVTFDNASGVVASDTAVLLLDAGGAVASGGNILRIAPTGTPNAGAIGIEFVGASKALNAMYIDADPTASDVVTINGGGALTDNNAVLTVMSDGALATGGNTFRVETAGTPASGAIYAEFNYTGITDSNENIGLKIDAGGKKVAALHVDADPIANDVAYIHSDAVIADNKAVLAVHSAGAIASGSNILRVTAAGTPASGAIYSEFSFSGITDTNENVGVWIDATGKKVQALKIDAAPLANSSVLVTSTGALAADKATMELISNVAACNADSAVLRVEQTATDGVATCVALKQDDLNIPFITFETTIGTGNALEAVGGKTLTTTHFVMVDIEGVGARYLPVGTIA